MIQEDKCKCIKDHEKKCSLRCSCRGMCQNNGYPLCPICKPITFREAAGGDSNDNEAQVDPNIAMEHKADDYVIDIGHASSSESDSDIDLSDVPDDEDTGDEAAEDIVFEHDPSVMNV